MTTTESNNLHGTNLSLEETPCTIQRSGNDLLRDARTIRTDSSSEQLPESAFANYNISPVIAGKEEDYSLICPIYRPSRTDLFRARGQKSGREVVIKCFLEDRSYLREKEVQELLKKHGGNVNLLLADEFLDNEQIMVSPFMWCGDVRLLEERVKVLTPHHVKSVISGLCDALQYLHELNIVHRDVKSANIILDGAKQLDLFMPPTPKLFDYEMGWHETVTPSSLEENPNLIVGTSYYLAPEVIKGMKYDPRSDIYAAGVTLYRFLTRGHLPFVGRDLTEVMEEHLRAPVPPLTQYNPKVSLELQYIVEKALAKDPNKRYQIAADLKRDYLEAVENNIDVDVEIDVNVDRWR
ncbi:MAG: serine/threonine-protein kinase [Nanoarchaeota archaeon]